MIWRYLLAGLGLGAFMLSRMLKQGGERIEERGGLMMDELVQDPACGVYIPRSQAVTRTIGGRRRHFCSRECARKYEKEQKN